MPANESDHYIDRIIQAAQADGEFDRLRGTGQPLTHLDSDPLNHLLDAQGFTPHWLELDHEIRQKIEIAEQLVRRTYEWVMQTWNGGGVDRRFAQDEWRKARHIFAERINEINQLIKTFNLELPEAMRHLQKFPLKKDEELARLGLRIHLA